MVNPSIAAALVTATVAVVGLTVTAVFTWRTQRLAARSEAWTRFDRGVDLVLTDQAIDTGWVILLAVMRSDLASQPDVAMMVEVAQELGRQRARRRRRR